MFILRRIVNGGKGVTINQSIGDSYTFIHREYEPEEFRNTFETFFQKKHVADKDSESDQDTKNCYAFVSHDGGKIQPLYKTQKNYIMTESGKTFENVTFV